MPVKDEDVPHTVNPFPAEGLSQLGPLLASTHPCFQWITSSVVVKMTLIKSHLQAPRLILPFVGMGCPGHSGALAGLCTTVAQGSWEGRRVGAGVCQGGG